MDLRDLPWRSDGPPLSEGDIAQFEAANNVRVPIPIRQFLQVVHNGGSPQEEVWFPIIGLEAEVGSALHGIFGINHPKDFYDYVSALEVFRPHLHKVFPIGYDPLNGKLVMKTGVEPAGEICYWPHDMFWNGKVEESLFRIAADFDAFLTSFMEPPED
jgi:hypothetical protein